MRVKWSAFGLPGANGAKASPEPASLWLLMFRVVVGGLL